MFFGYHYIWKEEKITIIYIFLYNVSFFSSYYKNFSLHCFLTFYYDLCRCTLCVCVCVFVHVHLMCLIFLELLGYLSYIFTKLGKYSVSFLLSFPSRTLITQFRLLCVLSHVTKVCLFFKNLFSVFFRIYIFYWFIFQFTDNSITYTQLLNQSEKFPL